MKTLGINVDGVIRNYLSQFDKQYRKSMIHNEGLIEMNDDMTPKERTAEEMEELAEKVKNLSADRINLPVDSPDLLNHYKFDGRITKYPAMNDLEVDTEVTLTPKQVLEEFMYESFPFQIFGAAEEYPGTSNSVNQIQLIGLKEGLFKTVMVSTLKGQGICATYSFLGRTGCRAKNVIFVNEDEEKWEHCDVLIDATPEAFQSKPDGKISIKINHLYNQYDQADYSFNSLKEANDISFLRKIFS
jgi:hypothetical protein